MWAPIVAKIVEMLISLGLKKKSESDGQHRKAAEKTIESVNESLKVEKEVRDEHRNVEKNPSNVEGSDGSLNFDRWNSGK